MCLWGFDVHVDISFGSGGLLWSWCSLMMCFHLGSRIDVDAKAPIANRCKGVKKELSIISSE